MEKNTVYGVMLLNITQTPFEMRPNTGKVEVKYRSNKGDTEILDSELNCS